MKSSKSDRCGSIKEASKWLYFILAGLAIGKGIEPIVGQWTGNVIDFLSYVFLYIGFLLTLIRFSFGFMGSIYENVNNIKSEYFNPLIVDLHFYVLNGICLIIIASNIGRIRWFVFWFIMMLLVDVFWIAYDHFYSKEVNVLGNCKHDKAKKQYLISDICFFLLLLIVFLATFLINELDLRLTFSILFLLVSVGLTFWDYYINRSYYELLG